MGANDAKEQFEVAIQECIFDGNTSPEALAAWGRYVTIPLNPVEKSPLQREQDSFTAGYDAARAVIAAEIAKARAEQLAEDYKIVRDNNPRVALGIFRVGALVAGGESDD
jgi:hypothetical protein